MAPLLDVLRSGRVLLMDGAMGTQLQCLGLRADENAVSWNLIHPHKVEQVHQSYADAGATVHLSNTFVINASSYRDAVARKGRENPTLGWSEALCRMREVGPYRLAAVGPVAGHPTRREFDDMREFHLPAKDFAHGCAPRPDGVMLETCSTPRAFLAVQRARQEGWPVFLSLAFRRNASGDLVSASGHAPEWFARRARDQGVDAHCVNCGDDIGLREIIEIVRRYRQVTDLHLFARPNAGTPIRHCDGLVYPGTPQTMAERLPELLQAGVSMIGGCCGTTPEHIEAFRRAIDEWNTCHSTVAVADGVRHR
jgi:5-methyltetrahydrofolate--homocysteine methyltransferase